MPYLGWISALALAFVACGGAQGGADAPDDDEVVCNGKNAGDACVEPDGDPGTCTAGKDPPHRLVCDDVDE